MLLIKTKLLGDENTSIVDMPDAENSKQSSFSNHVKV